jgi:DNA-binding transcriptional regulator YiaG
MQDDNRSTFDITNEAYKNLAHAHKRYTVTVAKTLMEKHGLTILEVARVLGVWSNTLKNWIENED